MNLKKGEREPSDEEDGIPQEMQYDFNLIAMDESDGDVNDENMALESSTSDSETVYSHSLSGVPLPSPDLARPSSSNLTVEEEEAETQVSSESESRTQPTQGNITPTYFTDRVLASPTISASGVEIVRELMDDVLMSFISNSDSETTIENQEAEAIVEGPGVLAASIRMHLEDLVPLESCESSQISEENVAGSVKDLKDLNLNEHREPQIPSLDPFPSSASTLLLSPETIPAGSGLSSGLVFSPDREPPIPIARSSPVIKNLNSRVSAEEARHDQGEDEENSSMSQDGLDDLDDEFESESDSDDGECFSGVMKGIEQLQPKTDKEEKEALNVSQDMFASQSQSQGAPTTQQSRPNDEIAIETESKEVEALMSNKCNYSTAALANFAMALNKATNVSQTDVSGQSQLSSTTSNRVDLVRPGPVIVPHNHQATPGTVTTNSAETLPPVGAKRPRQDDYHGHVEENLQAQDKAKRKLDFRQMRKRMSKSKRSGLVFPVSRINSRIKEGKYAKRSGVTAGVYMAAVLEYLVAEVAELAGQIAK